MSQFFQLSNVFLPVFHVDLVEQVSSMENYWVTSSIYNHGPIMSLFILTTWHLFSSGPRKVMSMIVQELNRHSQPES